MKIQINKEEDIQKILTIPNDQVSEELVKALIGLEEYYDTENVEHLFNAGDVQYQMSNVTPKLLEELIGILEVCNENEISYFRIASV